MLLAECRRVSGYSRCPSGRRYRLGPGLGVVLDGDEGAVSRAFVNRWLPPVGLRAAALRPDCQSTGGEPGAGDEPGAGGEVRSVG